MDAAVHADALFLKAHLTVDVFHSFPRVVVEVTSRQSGINLMTDVSCQSVLATSEQRIDDSHMAGSVADWQSLLTAQNQSLTPNIFCPVGCHKSSKCSMIDLVGECGMIESVA